MSDFLRRYFKSLVIAACICIAESSLASEVFVITDAMKEYHLSSKNVEILEDSTGTLSFQEVQSEFYSDKFKPSKLYEKGVQNTSVTYWLRFRIRNMSHPDTKWLLQAPLHSEVVEVFIPSGQGMYKNVVTGQKYDFSSREYAIRSVAFDIPAVRDSVLTFYAKISSHAHVNFDFLISNQNEYTGILVGGYYFLGFNYGIMFLMAVYNFILYFSIRDRVYLYYVFYTFCAAFFLTWKDGIGFQYFWPDFPLLNQYHHKLSLFLLLVAFMMYARNFLELPKKRKKLDYMMLGLMAVCLVYFVVTMFMPYYFDPLPAIYLITWACLYTIVINSLKKGDTHARYFIFGFTFVLISLSIIKLRYQGLIPWSWFVEYVLNYGMLIEVISMSLAMGDKVSLIRKQKEEAQKTTIEQLRENEVLKDKVNRELETKVKERTNELQQKTSELSVAKEQLQQAMKDLETVTAQLDIDNWKLKKNIKVERKLRVSDNEIISFQQFNDIFPDENSCYKYLEELKWGEDNQGYECKKCGNKKFSSYLKFSKKCSRCNYIETISSHTIFHGVKFPITKAFYIAYIALKDENVTSDALKEALDLRRDTCWKFKKKVIDRIEEVKVNLRVSNITNLDQIILDFKK